MRTYRQSCSSITDILVLPKFCSLVITCSSIFFFEQQQEEYIYIQMEHPSKALGDQDTKINYRDCFVGYGTTQSSSH